MQVLGQPAAEDVFGCQFVSHILFERRRDPDGLRRLAFPPPVCPSRPFGLVRCCRELGCECVLHGGRFQYAELRVCRVGLVGSVDAGLFARCGLGEYVGAVRHVE